MNRWDLEVKIGIPILAIVLLALVVLAIYVFARPPLRYGDKHGDRVFALGTLGVAAGVVIIAAIAYFPWQAQYHQYRVVTGTVSATSSRLISDGNKSVNQRILVQLKNDPLSYGCDDTRCTGLKPGDTVRLLCKASYQYASTPGEVCNWGGAA